MWKLSLQSTAALRKNALLGYISHVRQFALFTHQSMNDVFNQIASLEIDNRKLEKFFSFRAMNVEIDTALATITAFSWFYKMFHSNAFAHFHPEITQWLKSLHKRLKLEPRGSDALSFEDCINLLNRVKQFDWHPFAANDIFHLCVISLWGALRISESCKISHETSFINIGSKEIQVRIDIPDAKSAVGNEVQYKFVPTFDTRPDLCPVRAWNHLRVKSKSGRFVKDSSGNDLTVSVLSKKFRLFIDFCQKKRFLNPSGKFSWHVWRASWINISTTEFLIPLWYTQAGACHNVQTSTEGYAKRHAHKRKAQAANLSAARAAKKLFQPDKKSRPKPKITPDLPSGTSSEEESSGLNTSLGSPPSQNDTSCWF